MTCQEIQHWLLLSHPTTSLPGAVQRHLAACPRCRQRCEQLRMLDEQVRTLPTLPPNPSAKERLLARVAQTPQERPPAPVVRVHRRWVVAAAIAASVLIAVTWMIASRHEQRPNEQMAGKEEGNPSPLRAGTGGIVVRVAKIDVQLASPAAVEEQLDMMTRLAGDLKNEAIRLAKQGPSEDVSLLGDLCGNVMRQGVVGRAARLPADKRQQLVPPLLERLRTTETEIEESCKDKLPAVAAMLRPIGIAARESAERIEAGQAPMGPSQFSPGGTSPPLIASLVSQALKLAEESNPVRRADLSAELASQLTPAIVLLSNSGDTQGAEELGDCLGDLLDQGVGDNLAQAEADGMTAGQRDEVQKVRERSEEVISGLQENLKLAPPEVRLGLLRAIEATGGNPPADKGQTKPAKTTAHSKGKSTKKRPK